MAGWMKTWVVIDKPYALNSPADAPVTHTSYPATTPSTSGVRSANGRIDSRVA